MKKFIVSAFLVLPAVFLFAPALPVHADAVTDLYNTCSVQNPEGTLKCSADKRYVAGSCKTETEARPSIQDCLNRGRVFSCPAGCTSACSDSNKKNCNGTCITPYADDGVDDGVDDGKTCAAAFLTFNDCTGKCGSCSAGYELIGGKCVNLAMVEGRVASLEGVQLCFFNEEGKYVDPQGNSCEFDPSSINIRLNAFSSALDALVQLVAAIFPNIINITDVTEIINSIIEGDYTTAQEFQTMITELYEQITDIINGAAGVSFVGITTAKYTAGFTGAPKGYLGANAVCAAQFTGSHVCTNEEILALYNTGVTLPTSGKAWISGGAPGHSEPANDCQGWSVTGSVAYGRYWNFEKISGWLSQCTPDLYGFACCK
ncbi:hypothetical protein JXA05_00085 [Candidatus Peregrinibacteria bacterium]|nr:hypothetical protein [Candidatus Peregrinibacteria bacterium]